MTISAEDSAGAGPLLGEGPSLYIPMSEMQDEMCDGGRVQLHKRTDPRVWPPAAVPASRALETEEVQESPRAREGRPAGTVHCSPAEISRVPEP